MANGSIHHSVISVTKLQPEQNKSRYQVTGQSRMVEIVISNSTLSSVSFSNFIFAFFPCKSNVDLFSHQWACLYLILSDSFFAIRANVSRSRMRKWNKNTLAYRSHTFRKKQKKKKLLIYNTECRDWKKSRWDIIFPSPWRNIFSQGVVRERMFSLGNFIID